MTHTEYMDDSSVFDVPDNFAVPPQEKLDSSPIFESDINETVNLTYYYGEGDDEFVRELYVFNKFWESLLNILEPCEIGLLALGFVGNLLAFITLLRSQRMYTPSFLYHRALVGADLLFCTNFFINLMIDRLASVSCKQQIFKYRFAAFYSATINPLMNSVCAYALCYATMAVTLDRFIALAWFRSYQIWNQRRIAFLVITVSLCLSISVHSWTTFVQNHVIESDLNDTSLIWEPCWDDHLVYHWVKRENLGRIYDTASNVKNIYNASFKIAYPFLLASLTLGIIYGLVMRGRRKRRLRRSLTTETQQPSWHQNLNIPSAVRRRHRCEQSLFLLTIAVLILAFLQVASSEGRRILQFVFPAAEIIKTKVDNSRLSMDERMTNFRWVLYAHQATRALANFFTVVERSAICFLYVATNKLFRGELIVTVTSGLSACGLGRDGVLGEMRRRLDSDARTLRRRDTATVTTTSFTGVQSQEKRTSMNVVVRKKSDRRGSDVSLLLFVTK